MTRDIFIIIAHARDGTIAKGGDVPWKISNDLKRFKRLTTGRPMIMGRKTFDALPRLLPGRRHIVLTRQQGWSAPGAEVARTVDEALALAGPGDLAVIGGNEIVELFLPHATRLELTEVHEDTAGDVFMAPPGPDWREAAREAHPAEGNDPAYDFVSWERLPSRKREGDLMRFGHRDPMPGALRGAILALGNFDGFHLGHQAVVREAIAWARAEGRPAIVATFDPHPVRHFAPHVPWFRLTSLEQRAELFAAAGAEAMLVFEFGDELAATTAEDFVGRLLGDHLGAAGVVTGEDFTFGKGRTGTVALLAAEGARHGIAARTVGPVSEGRLPVSSSRIRDALKAGECETATRLMTRPFAIRAIVQHGDKRGRAIGFPTANLDMGHYLRPRYGIYAVTGRVLDSGQELKGAASLGVRPTFDPPKELLEPYFFDFDGDLYGREVEVALHHFLRPEAKFDSVEALQAQMAEDCARAAELLG